ncbi:hypothetical protein D3C85_1543710 [compost metagenome]
MMTIGRAMSPEACRQVKPPRMNPSAAGSLNASPAMAVDGGNSIREGASGGMSCKFIGFGPLRVAANDRPRTAYGQSIRMDPGA